MGQEGGKGGELLKGGGRQVGHRPVWPGHLSKEKRIWGRLGTGDLRSGEQEAEGSQGCLPGGGVQGAGTGHGSPKRPLRAQEEPRSRAARAPRDTHPNPGSGAGLGQP